VPPDQPHNAEVWSLATPSTQTRRHAALAATTAAKVAEEARGGRPDVHLHRVHLAV
jgi:hypothetical protein